MKRGAPGANSRPSCAFVNSPCRIWGSWALGVVAFGPGVRTARGSLVSPMCARMARTHLRLYISVSRPPPIFDFRFTPTLLGHVLPFCDRVISRCGHGPVIFLENWSQPFHAHLIFSIAVSRPPIFFDSRFTPTCYFRWPFHTHLLFSISVSHRFGMTWVPFGAGFRWGVDLAQVGHQGNSVPITGYVYVENHRPTGACR